MESDEQAACGAWVPGPMDLLGHLLIRAHNGDDLDPFFVPGHPAMEHRGDRLVRSCFYYSVVVTPRVTAVYDNDGAGGMCSMDPSEIAAVWRTPRLLEALGVDFESLSNGTADVEGKAVPEPCWRAGAPSPDVEESLAPGMR